jgi:steroid 5-alpha reductase family enzyme
MPFFQIYLKALLGIMFMMTLLWIISIFLKNVSIVDIFWGIGFIVASSCYYYYSQGNPARKLIVESLVVLWGLRLSIYLAWRNNGKGEDFRYQEFRRKAGPGKFWWTSFFRVFLLQGILMWIISAPLLGAQYNSNSTCPGLLDYIAILVWLVGFSFETGGDLQLARFKLNPLNKGKLLDTGFWHYTRHPNYFGDSAVWWSFGLLSLAGSSYLPALGAVLMTALIIKVSGVALLEKSLKEKKPEYHEYIRTTNAFIPWFPRKKQE